MLRRCFVTDEQFYQPRRNFLAGVTSRCFVKFRVTQGREMKVFMLYFLVAILGVAVAGNQAPESVGTLGAIP